MPYVCVTLTEADVYSTVKLANSLDCDIIEVRLDHLKDKSVLQRLKDIRKPLMVTCMPKWEGGAYNLSEEKRIELLKSVLDYADYVTIELKTREDLRQELIDEAHGRGVKVIVSYHDFEKTPKVEDMLEILYQEADAGADIVKVAFKPKKYIDVLAVLEAQLLAELKIPIIALSMGELGRITRVVGPMLGGYLTFAAPSSKSRADAGQYSIYDMKEIRRLLWDENR
ncbi:MAG: type I 3-dehydroquinate dehydratase [Candidatus Altiarchaeota archaeon]